MARRVIEDGFPTTLWARRVQSLEPFGDTGAACAPDRRALGAASDVLCLCVTGDADVDEILRGDEGAEVIANSGRSLSVIAELAGPLLAKDVGILAALMGANFPELLQMATATIDAMHLNDPVKPSAQ